MVVAGNIIKQLNKVFAWQFRIFEREIGQIGDAWTTIEFQRNMEIVLVD